MKNLKKFDQFTNESFNIFDRNRDKKESQIEPKVQIPQPPKKDENKIKDLQNNESYLMFLIKELKNGNFKKTKVNDEVYDGDFHGEYRILMNDRTKILVYNGLEEGDISYYQMIINNPKGEKIESIYIEDDLVGMAYYTEVSKELMFLVIDVAKEDNLIWD